MKKFIAFLIVLSICLISITGICSNNPYENYNKISGMIETTKNFSVKENDTFKVNVAVNFNDKTPIEQVTAFHILGNCSDNLEIVGYDFYDSDKKFSNVITTHTDESNISYMAAATPSEKVISSDSDGYARLIWIEFKAKDSGNATIHFDGSYIRSNFEDKQEYKRCLIVDDLTFKISSSSSSSGSSSSSANKGGSTILTGKTDEENAKNDEKTEKVEGNQKNDINDSDNNKNIKFSDVEGSHWGYEYVKDLYDRKIVSGSGVDKENNPIINPNSNITRQEAAKIAVLATNLDLENGQLEFIDVNDITDWAKDYVFTSFNNGIIKGYEDNTFKAQNSITREELTTVIIKAFGFDISNDEKMNEFIDADSITWSSSYVVTGVKLGIIKGYDDKTFRPQEKINRVEAITMFSRAISIYENSIKNNVQ